MNTTIKKDKYELREEALKEYKELLEAIWSGFSEVVEKAEEFEYSIESDDRLNSRLRETLRQFYDYKVEELKYQAEIGQGEACTVIENFKEQHLISEED